MKLPNIPILSAGIILGIAVLACGNTVPEIIPNLTELPPIVTLTPTPVPPTPDPAELETQINEYQAGETITNYAAAVLGLALPPVAARSVEGDIEFPVGAQEGLDAVAEISGATYFGIFENGIAAVSLGSGKISGDVAADIHEASLGLFTIGAEQPYPENSEDALALIQETFPGIAGLQFESLVIQGEGVAFQARDTDQAITLRDGQITLQGGVVTAGVAPAVNEGRVFVWVAVAAGDLAAAFEQFLP